MGNLTLTLSLTLTLTLTLTVTVTLTLLGRLGGSDFWGQMNRSGYIIGSSEYYDPYNPAARELFYQFSKQSMFDIGVATSIHT